MWYARDKIISYRVSGGKPLKRKFRRQDVYGRIISKQILKK
jgi:hypothetical protein